MKQLRHLHRAPVASRLAAIAAVTTLLGCNLDRGTKPEPAGERAKPSGGTDTAGSKPIKDLPASTAESGMALEIKEAMAHADDLVPKSPTGWQIPAELSAAPTVDEWNASPRVAVRNADALGCYSNIVREWVRVSCRTSGGAASAIQDVQLVQPKGLPHFYRFVADGVASMTFPVRHAIDAQVEFTWERFSRLLTVKWVPGAKSPSVYFHGNVPAVAGKKLCSAVCSNGLWYMSAGNCQLAEFRCWSGYACAYPMCRCTARDCVDDF